MEDRCGECGKDGNSCRRVVSRFTDSPSQSGKKNLCVIFSDYFTMLLLVTLNPMKIQTRSY